MDLAGVTPSEGEIDDFLSSTGAMYREVFIKFCFHYWERRHEKYIINKAIAELQLYNVIN
jgi:adenosylmethionine-8-amino-7-oxononanoate aminotransferase